MYKIIKSVIRLDSEKGYDISEGDVVFETNSWEVISEKYSDLTKNLTEAEYVVVDDLYTAYELFDGEDTVRLFIMEE